MGRIASIATRGARARQARLPARAGGGGRATEALGDRVRKIVLAIAQSAFRQPDFIQDSKKESLATGVPGEIYVHLWPGPIYEG
jgi:hypothetical protein